MLSPFVLFRFRCYFVGGGDGWGGGGWLFSFPSFRITLLKNMTPQLKIGNWGRKMVVVVVVVWKIDGGRISEIEWWVWKKDGDGGGRKMVVEKWWWWRKW